MNYNINELPDNRHYVLDISHWHPVQDANLIPDKVVGVAVKVCQGSESDPTAWDNIHKLTAAKIPIIIYNFVTYRSTDKWLDWLSVTHYAHCVTGAMIDIERYGDILPRHEYIRGAVKAAKEKCRAFVYGNKDDIEEWGGDATLGSCFRWIANYNVAPGDDVPLPSFWDAYDLHQFTDSCECPGFDEPVDCSICSHDMAEWFLARRREIRS